MISFVLDEEQELLRGVARKFAAEVIRPEMRAWEQAREVAAEARRGFDELGLALIDVPENFGGAGQGLLSAALIHEELAFGDPAAAVALWSPHLGAAAVVELADDQQAQRWLARFGGGELGALAWSEPLGGPLEGFSTRAERVEGGYRLQGKKAWVVNAGRAGLTIVFAQVEAERGWDGIGAFAIEGAADGMKAGERAQLLALDALPIAPLELDGVLVPEGNRLLGRGDFSRGLRRLMCRALLVGAARQVGLARASYEFALAYTQERQAFGKPVAHFQSIAFTLADMHMDVESARWMLWRAAAAFDACTNEKAPLANIERLAAEASAHANEAAFRVADHGVQLLGGAGFIRDFPVEKWLRDTRALALLSPSDQLAQLAAASVLLGETSPHALLPSSAIQPVIL